MNINLKHKIFNPKTKRYINTDSKSGIVLMNNYENIKKKYQENNLENPLSDNYLNISDKGLVSQDRINPLLLKLQNLVGNLGIFILFLLILKLYLL